MRNATIFLLFVAVGALGIFAFYQEASLREQRRLLQELTARLKPVSKTADLDLQQKCARQARHEFSAWDKQPMASVTNHYNSKLGKCFVVIEVTDTTTPGTAVTNKFLADAFEEKSYAEYQWHSDKVKKYWEVPPLVCNVTLPSGEVRVCHSSGEFDDLIKVYNRGIEKFSGGGGAWGASRRERFKSWGAQTLSGKQQY